MSSARQASCVDTDITAAIELAEGLRSLCELAAARELRDPPFGAMGRLATRMLGHLESVRTDRLRASAGAVEA